MINVKAKNKHEVFREVFQLLNLQDSVLPSYLDSMITRDKSTSVAIGNFIAIAHGTVETKHLIKKDAMCLLVLENPIDWDGNEVKVVLGLALSGDKTMEVIGNIGVAFSEEDRVKEFFYQNDLTVTKILTWLDLHDK